jgi:hypothetical protein
MRKQTGMTTPLLLPEAPDPARRSSGGSTASTDSTSSAGSLRSSSSRSTTSSLLSWICAGSRKPVHVYCADGDVYGLKKVLEKQCSETARFKAANDLDAQQMSPLDCVLSFARANRPKETAAVDMATALIENGAIIDVKLPTQAKNIGLYVLANYLSEKMGPGFTTSPVLRR